MRISRVRRGQWKKWRVPVRYIVTPAACAAAITSSSRTEPPGCTTARHAGVEQHRSPSANGKNASEAATDPAARSPARVTASRHESTRLTWPMPMPTVAPSAASRIALDLTDRHGRPGELEVGERRRRRPARRPTSVHAGRVVVRSASMRSRRLHQQAAG